MDRIALGVLAINNFNAMLLTLLTAFLTSGAVSAGVSFYLSSRREEMLLCRRKLEALFKALTQWTKSYGIFSLHFRFAMIGEMDINYVYEEMKNLAPAEEKDNLEAVEMIIGVYFPELRPYYNDLMKTRDRINQVIGAFEDEQKTTPKSVHNMFVLLTPK